ncbi:tetratricopeptide repeat protein [Propionicicella superfundia]|uniref:tetratricopeptide repeat protein n=1 Tax=Propionicicella superfundia TaxID=348582 RepID=UPI0003F678B3|nr:tetratricopeptide repeat protein [Propionicicella superfundia]
MSLTHLTYELAVQAFDRRDYRSAIRRFRELRDVEPGNHAVREYLARAYYHSAALPLAEQESRAILDEDPTNVYVGLLLARSLERQSRHDEAMTTRRMLAAMTGDDRYLER